MKLAPQQIIDKLSLPRLIIHARRLILEDQIIVPTPFHRKRRAGQGTWCTRCRRCLSECSLEVEEWVTHRYFFISISGVGCVCFGVLSGLVGGYWGEWLLGLCCWWWGRGGEGKRC